MHLHFVALYNLPIQTLVFRAIAPLAQLSADNILAALRCHPIDDEQRVEAVAHETHRVDDEPFVRPPSAALPFDFDSKGFALQPDSLDNVASEYVEAHDDNLARHLRLSAWHYFEPSKHKAFALYFELERQAYISMTLLGLHHYAAHAALSFEPYTP